MAKKVVSQDEQAFQCKWFYTKPPFIINPDFARKYGLHKAAVIQIIHEIIQESTHYREGCRWAKINASKIKSRYDFWPTSQLQYILKELSKEKILRFYADGDTWYSTLDYYVLSHGKREDKQLQLGDITPPQEAKRRQYDAFIEAFEDFWQEYPARMGKKTGKKQARQQWVKLAKSFYQRDSAGFSQTTRDNGLLDTIMRSLKNHKATAGWSEDDGKYIPMAERWLSEKRFEDEITQEEQPLKAKKGSDGLTARQRYLKEHQHVEQQTGNSGRGCDPEPGY